MSETTDKARAIADEAAKAAEDPDLANDFQEWRLAIAAIYSVLAIAEAMEEQSDTMRLFIGRQQVDS